MAFKVIPLTNNPNQVMLITIPVDNKNLTLKLNIKYNSVANYWIMTIIDPKTNEIILDNIPLLTGKVKAADILHPYQYLCLGSAAVVNIGSVNDFPSDLDLGTDFVLCWGDTVVEQ